MNDPSANRPVLSHQVMKKKVFPQLGEESVFVIVIDNLRFDQWKVLEEDIVPYFNVEEEDIYFSILPTTTTYARNSIFSGELPADMAKKHSDLWVLDDDNEEGKNNNEEEFLRRQLKKNGLDIEIQLQQNHSLKSRETFE